jgi:hypothetical protein
MDVRQLAKLNGLSSKAEVHAGQKIVVSEPETMAVDETSSHRGHGKNGRHATSSHPIAKAYHSEKPDRSENSGKADRHKSSAHGHESAPKSSPSKKGSKKK